MENWTISSQNSKKLAKLFVWIFPSALFASSWKVILATRYRYLICYFSPITPKTRWYRPHASARLSRTPSIQGEISRVRQWCWQHRFLMGLMTRVINPVWVWHGCRFGLVLKSTPTKQPSKLPRDNLHVTIVGLEGLSNSGVYELCLDSPPGHTFLDRGCRYLSALCCTGFE